MLQEETQQTFADSAPLKTPVLEISSCRLTVQQVFLIFKCSEKNDKLGIDNLLHRLDQLETTSHIQLSWERNLLCSAKDVQASQPMQIQWQGTQTKDLRFQEPIQIQHFLTAHVVFNELNAGNILAITNVSDHLYKIMTTQGQNYGELQCEATRLHLSACYSYNQHMERARLHCKAKLGINAIEAKKMTSQIVWNICREMNHIGRTCHRENKLKWIMMAECVRYAVQDWQIKTARRLLSRQAIENAGVLT